MEKQKTQDSQNNPLQEKNFQRYHHPWFQALLQSYSPENSLVLEKNRQGEKWNRIENPDINPHTYEHLIFDK